MKKIGLLLSEEPFGGGKFQYSLSVVEALAALPESEYDIVVAYKNIDWHSYLDKYNFKMVHIPACYSDRLINKLWRNLGIPHSWGRLLAPYIYPFAKAIIRNKRDLWISPVHDFLTYQVPVPVLATIHDLMHRYEPRFPEVSGQHFKDREYNYGAICHWAKGVLVDSEVGKQQVIESYNVLPTKVYVLPYIVPQYINNLVPPSGFEQRYRLPAKYIFYPAQFWEHKNHRGLLEAAASLKEKAPDLQLVLVGSPKNSYECIHELVEQKGLLEKVHFLGYVPNEDLPQFYLRARALVMPTFFGPTNIPPLEAMALGCPAAVSDIYAMKEQVGDAALLFNPNSVSEIAECIYKLWRDDDLCHLLSQKGQQRAALCGQSQFNQRLQTIVASLIW